MKTFLGNPIKDSTLGILYLCNYLENPPTLTVFKEIQFESGAEALDAYANTPNPPSQLAAGKDKKSFEVQLSTLHARMNNPDWVKELADYL